MNIKPIVWSEPVYDRVNFLLRRADGRFLAEGLPVVMKELTEEENAAHREPTFHLQMHEAQQLMDGLWSCGLRPSEGSGSAGALAATQKHLEDMRVIAMHKLGIEQK